MSATATLPESTALRLAVVIGSTREGRFAPTVARWFAGVAQQQEGISVDVIDLAEAGLPEVLSRQRGPEVTALADRLSAADAFVIVTPEYNHSFPAPLKTAIDWFGREWQARPIGFVSYGGKSGGLRAVEQLRLVFAELHTMTVRESVSFHNAWEEFDPAGQPRARERAERSAQAMLRQLTWWAEAVKEAKRQRPYTG